MYIPAAFRVEAASKLEAFVKRHSFATLVTHDGSGPYASHLPMLFRSDMGDKGALLSHMAKANPQWRHFESGREALIIFSGPHSYISPSWYQTGPAVPTWNYAAVHAYGVPVTFSERERVLALLRDTISTYEGSLAQPWSGDLPESYRDKHMQNIVAFEIPILRMEGKFKFSQNRPAEDVQKVIEELSRSNDADNHALAQMMMTELSENE